MNEQVTSVSEIGVSDAFRVVADSEILLKHGHHHQNAILGLRIVSFRRICQKSVVIPMDFGTHMLSHLVNTNQGRIDIQRLTAWESYSALEIEFCDIAINIQLVCRVQECE
ncbi:MAG: hypothetical protein WCJ09_25955 [Planctomycetota bacterium]